MARYFGTTYDDTIAGVQTEANTFFNFGIGSDTVVGGNLNDTFVLSVDERTDFIYGGLGEDRIDYSQSDRELTIDLSKGMVDAGTTVVAKLSSIEDATGTNFRDTIIGTGGDNTIEGRGGADYIDGGAGTDTASYVHSAVAVQINLNQVVQHGGDAEGDQLYSIENVIGSSYKDTLIGNSSLNYLSGGAGDDHLFGGFDGHIDVLDGGSGSDTVDYSSAPHSMTIALDNGGIDGSATLDATDLIDFIIGVPFTFHIDAVQEDSLRSIENVIGTAGDDHITGNDANNRLEGGAGLDVINGGAGSDVIIGGPGGDTLFGGNDNVVDTFVFADFHDSMLHTTVVDHQVIQDGIDAIMDFHPGQDRIDLSGMEAQVTGGAQLHFIATNSNFTGHPGEILVQDPSLLASNIDNANNASSNEDYVHVWIDVNGDKAPDFYLTVVSPFSLDNAHQSDFFLW